MPSYRITDQAKADIKEILAYIARDDRAAALRVKAKFQKAMRNLSRFPGLGHTREDATDAPVLFWAVYSYLIVYAAGSRPLVILTVVHGERNLPAELRKRLRGV